MRSVDRATTRNRTSRLENPAAKIAASQLSPVDRSSAGNNSPSRSAAPIEQQSSQLRSQIVLEWAKSKWFRQNLLLTDSNRNPSKYALDQSRPLRVSSMDAYHNGFACRSSEP
jgi:hypothetical protein